MKLKKYLEVEGETVVLWARNLLINLLPDFWLINKSVRPALARLCGMQCGTGVMLQKGIFYGNPKNVSIGVSSIICRGAFLDGFDKITIGNNVAIAFQVTFITSTHELGTKEKRVGRLSGSPIVIGDGVWIAARAIIGPGTEIGAGSMISAGAALMHSVPPNSLVSGVPGKVVTRLEYGVGANKVVEPTAAPSSCPATQSLGGTNANRLTEPITASVSETEREDAVHAPERSDDGTSGNGSLTKAEFYAELETLLEMERGSIQGKESLHDLPNWDSMAVLAFIALADMKLHEVASPAVLANCLTVHDLANLFPGKIT